MGRVPGALINEENEGLARLNVAVGEEEKREGREREGKFAWVGEICEEEYEGEGERGKVWVPSVRIGLG